MTKTVQGVVRGRTIELDDDLGVADGQQVEIQVRTVQPRHEWGQGIRRSAGGWADYPEIDAIMETIQRERQLECRPQLETRLAFEQTLDGIERENVNRDLSDVRKRLNARSANREVIAPTIDARVEEANEIARLRNRADVGSLPAIAVDARISEVFRRSLTTVFLADRVIDLAAEPCRLHE